MGRSKNNVTRGLVLAALFAFLATKEVVAQSSTLTYNDTRIDVIETAFAELIRVGSFDEPIGIVDGYIIGYGFICLFAFAFVFVLCILSTSPYREILDRIFTPDTIRMSWSKKYTLQVTTMVIVSLGSVFISIDRARIIAFAIKFSRISENVRVESLTHAEALASVRAFYDDAGYNIDSSSIARAENEVGAETMILNFAEILVRSARKADPRGLEFSAQKGTIVPILIHLLESVREAEIRADIARSFVTHAARRAENDDGLHSDVADIVTNARDTLTIREVGTKARHAQLRTDFAELIANINDGFTVDAVRSACLVAVSVLVLAILAHGICRIFLENAICILPREITDECFGDLLESLEQMAESIPGWRLRLYTLNTIGLAVLFTLRQKARHVLSGDSTHG